ncbi:FUSC family protein [Paraburkholderia oxyphila]|uniref:FUSC family protein n=1 Tax=Paraburkholderia oxyphila TaxID=614212 RepID=UPI000694E5C9|nr:FUSC family protein [Paraburkholderia oxyphila]
MNEPIAQRLANRWDWLARELAPFPGRGQFALRVTLACVISIVISETFQVPQTAMSLVAVLFTAQANITMTRVISVALAVANLIAIGFYVVVLQFTFDYPLLRIVCSSIIFFACMFCVRISKAFYVLLGPALVLLYAQSFVDMTGQADYLVRQLLWAALAITYGSVIMLLVNSLFSSTHPERQLRAEVHRQLERAAERLRRLVANEPAPPALSPQALQQQVASLQSLLDFADMARPKDRAGNVYLQACVAAVSRAQHICNTLPGELAAASPALRSALGRLQAQLPALEAAVAGEAAFRLTWAPDTDERAALAALRPANDLYCTLEAISHFDAAAMPDQAAAKPPLLPPDTFTNPAYVRFALKVLISGLLGYFVYNSVQWAGIHTILITSALVAMPGLGTSVRQMTLRLYGALFGSLAALLVFLIVMPRIDTIVGLLLATMPVMALGAWVAAGSERMAYMGIQGAATAALALFEHFGPSTDLTEIRDRMVGILLGVCICWVVYALIWPDSEHDATRSKLAALLRSLAQLVRAPLRQDEPAQQIVYAQRQMQCWSSLNECDMDLERVRFEPQFKHGAMAQLATQADALLAVVREMLVEQDRIRGQASGTPIAAPGAGVALASAATLRDETAALIEHYAARVAQGGEPPSAGQAELRAHAGRIAPADAPPVVAHVQRLACLAADLPGWTRPAAETDSVTAGPTSPRKAP